MLYMNEADIRKIGISWKWSLELISGAIASIAARDYSQPVKCYLRYQDPANRIIAMPAYIGGDSAASGIKWIASFPANIGRGLHRAHSVTILNDAGSGVPVCMINTALISGIRTAALSGFIIREVLNARTYEEGITLGIIGFGPIGQLHLQMVCELLGGQLEKVLIYDVRPVDPGKVPEMIRSKVKFCDNWEEPFQQADIFITATVSPQGYISGVPKKASLHLNVSLRDYLPGFRTQVNKMLVDDWEEVCRENTDIEMMYKSDLLKKEDTYAIADFIHNHPFNNLEPADVIMFNPMGMAVFDIALGTGYYQTALEKGIGTQLES